MKTLQKFMVVLSAIVFLTACAGLQPTKPVKDGQVLSLEELVSKSGANVVRAFTCLTGGTTGCLDKISRTVITNGDIAMVVTGNIIYFYQYNGSATEAESSPTYIRPDDYSTSGVWYLVDVRAKGVNTGTSTQPSIDFYDADATAGDINAKIYVNCTDNGNGTEDCDMYFQTQTAGTLTTKLHIDADGNIDFQAMPIITTGTISGKLPTVSDGTATTYNITQAQARAATFFVNTYAGTKTFVLPAAEAGMAICIKNGQGVAQVLRIDTDGSDYIVKSTGARTTVAGDYYGATADAKNQICVACFDATDWYVTSEVGTWTEE